MSAGALRVVTYAAVLLTPLYARGCTEGPQPLYCIVHRYTGVREAIHNGWKQPSRLAALHPSSLADADLVLTTFETLRSELDHAPEPRPGGLGGSHGESAYASMGGAYGAGREGGGAGDVAAGGEDVAGWRSRASRSGTAVRAHATARLLSPLLSLHWWRVVLDEAQMVESGTAKAAAMALRLSTTHRWAVSGTPMGRGRLADLHGLMAFLQVPRAPTPCLSSPDSLAAWTG